MKHVRPKTIQDQLAEYERTKEVLNLFKSLLELEKMKEYKIYRNLEKSDIESLIDTFNKYELFEILYFSVIEGLYHSENYYVTYNADDRRLESFDSLGNVDSLQIYLKEGVEI